jgi:hypothetical protein
MLCGPTLCSGRRLATVSNLSQTVCTVCLTCLVVLPLRKKVHADGTTSHVEVDGPPSTDECRHARRARELVSDSLPSWRLWRQLSRCEHQHQTLCVSEKETCFFGARSRVDWFCTEQCFSVQANEAQENKEAAGAEGKYNDPTFAQILKNGQSLEHNTSHEALYHMEHLIEDGVDIDSKDKNKSAL